MRTSQTTFDLVAGHHHLFRISLYNHHHQYQRTIIYLTLNWLQEHYHRVTRRVPHTHTSQHTKNCPPVVNSQEPLAITYANIRDLLLTFHLLLRRSLLDSELPFLTHPLLLLTSEKKMLHNLWEHNQSSVTRRSVLRFLRPSLCVYPSSIQC